jgi:SanA protein
MFLKKYFNKYFFIILTLLVLLSFILILLSHYIIESKTDNLVYNDINKIPHNKVGLLLGTSKYLKNGDPNNYFRNRIKATIDLYNAGKIDYIVISGDNGKTYYNEPVDMKNELIAVGIPANKIFLDYAGFRTYDSIIRMNKIFGQSSFTIISQEFQNRRAIYIASRLGYNAVGYNAQDINFYHGLKTKIRECFARANVFLDLMINRNPKFLGERIEIM